MDKIGNEKLKLVLNWVGGTLFLVLESNLVIDFDAISIIIGDAPFVSKSLCIFYPSTAIFIIRRGILISLLIAA
jgi:uncharacterized membrane protein